MKVLINAAAAKMGGAVTYLASLLRHLPPPASGHQFLVMLPPQTAEAQKDLPANVRLFPTEAGSRGTWRRIWWEQVTLRGFLKRTHADILYSAANFGLLFCPVKQVLLLQSALYFSDMYQRTFLTKYSLRTRLRFKFRRWLMCQSVRHADLVMTPTRALLDDLSHYAELSPGKAMVNPYGVNLFRPPEKDGSRAAAEPRLEAAPSIRLLYVSLYNDYKNLTTLLKALPLLNENGKRRFTLTTTANPDWINWTVTCREDLALARSPTVAPSVEFVGPLTTEQTLEAYRQADIFVFPSLLESFGFPLAEAMAAGLPIVAADTSMNREISGDAAVYFEPLSPEDLAKQIEQMVTDPALRARLRAAAVERAAKQLRWEDHARRLVEGAVSLTLNGASNRVTHAREA